MLNRVAGILLVLCLLDLLPVLLDVTRLFQENGLELIDCNAELDALEEIEDAHVMHN